MRALIFHNFWLKCFSIALGTVIWMAVHYSIEHDFDLYEPASRQVLHKETIGVRVTTIQQPGDTRVFKITPATVLLTIVGNASTLRGPGMKDVKIFVDLTDFRSRTAQMEDLHPDVPHGLNVLDFEPSSVTVEPIHP
jgi:YbbR domain-containing protein